MDLRCFKTQNLEQTSASNSWPNFNFNISTTPQLQTLDHTSASKSQPMAFCWFSVVDSIVGIFYNQMPDQRHNNQVLTAWVSLSVSQFVHDCRPKVPKSKFKSYWHKNAVNTSTFIFHFYFLSDFSFSTLHKNQIINLQNTTFIISILWNWLCILEPYNKDKETVLIGGFNQKELSFGSKI